MKRLLFALCIAISTMIAFPVVANAETVNSIVSYTELTETDLEDVYFVNVKEYMYSIGITEEEYPYWAYAKYYTSADIYVIMCSTTPIYIASEKSTSGHFNLYASGEGTCKAYYTWKGVNAVENYGSGIGLNPNYNIYFTANDSVYIDGDTTNPFFGEALSTLAGIVKESNRQLSPMLVVISCLPFVIFLVASLVGLRKCLQMLQTILRGA